MLEEHLGLVNHRRYERGWVVSLCLVMVDDQAGKARKRSGEAHLLTGQILVGSVRIKQCVLDKAGLDLGCHLAFQFDDRVRVDDRSLAVADELEVDWVGGWKLACDTEDHPFQSWGLLDCSPRCSTLERPVVGDHGVEAFVSHHVGGLELPRWAVFPAWVLDSSVGHDADGVYAKGRGLCGLSGR